MNKMYGFEGEVRSKYSSTMVDLFTEVFNHLPLAHCIDGKILVRVGRVVRGEGGACRLLSLVVHVVM